MTAEENINPNILDVPFRDDINENNIFIINQANYNEYVLNQNINNRNRINQLINTIRNIILSLMSILIVVEIIIYAITEIKYTKESNKINWTIDERESEDDADFKGVIDVLFLMPLSILFSLIILIFSCSCCSCRNSFPVAKIIIFIILYIFREWIVLYLIMSCTISDIKSRLDCSDIFNVPRIVLIIDNFIFIRMAIANQIIIKIYKV